MAKHTITLKNPENDEDIILELRPASGFVRDLLLKKRDEEIAASEQFNKESMEMVASLTQEEQDKFWKDRVCDRVVFEANWWYEKAKVVINTKQLTTKMQELFNSPATSEFWQYQDSEDCQEAVRIFFRIWNIPG